MGRAFGIQQGVSWDAARCAEIRQSGCDFCHREHGEVRAGGTARFTVGPIADDQRPDTNFDAYDAAKKRSISGAAGQSASVGYPLCAHASRRDRKDPRRIAAKSTRMQKRELSWRSKVVTEA